MRRVVISVALLVVLILVSSCILEGEPEGQVTLRFDDTISESSRTIYSPGYGNPIVSYALALDGPSGFTLNFEDITLDASDSYLIESIGFGTWEVTATGYDAEGNYRGEGSAEFTVSTEPLDPVTIEIGFAGACDVDILIQWPESTIVSPVVAGYIAPVASGVIGTQDPLTFTLSDDSIQVTTPTNTIPAGTHLTHITIHDGETLVWVFHEMMYLDKGTVTRIEKILSARDLFLEETTVSITETLPERLSLSIEPRFSLQGLSFTPKALTTEDQEVSLDGWSWFVNGVAASPYDDSDLPFSAINSRNPNIILQGIYDNNLYTKQETSDVDTLTFSPEIVSGGGTTYLRISDDLVYSFGQYLEQQEEMLLRGEDPDGLVVALITELSSVSSLDIASSHAAAVIDGLGYSWGRNSTHGVLGIGTTFAQYVPQVIIEESDNPVEQIDVGTNHSLARMEDGTIRSWGFNEYKQILDSSETSYSSPVTIPGFTSVIDVAAGRFQSFVLKSDGTVWGWGDNRFNQVSSDSSEIINIPVQIPTSAKFVDITTYGYSTYGLTATGDLYSWGHDVGGSLGQGSSSATYSDPVRILTNVKQVVSGYAFAMALTFDGKLYTWGYNTHGQLGNGTEDSSSTPGQILTDIIITSIGCGEYEAFATSATTIYGWGLNDDGQLGLGEAHITEMTFEPEDFYGVKTPVAWSFD